jgi:hypothetical protein
MPRKTDGERIDDLQSDVRKLETLVAGMLEQLKNTTGALNTLDETCEGTGQGLDDLRRECEKTLVGLEKEIAEFRRWTEKNGTTELKTELSVLKEKTTKLETAQERSGARAWSVVPNLIGAVVSVLLGAGVAYLVSRWGK